MILLDTHMVLALLGQVDLILTPQFVKELQGRSKKFVSVATIWEIAIKNRIGKLKLEFDINQLPTMLQRLGFEILDISVNHTLASIGTEPKTNDPFDRLLLCVCATEDLRLLTIDRALVSHPLAWNEES